MNKKNNKNLYYLLGAIGVLVAVAILGKQMGWIGKAPEIGVEFGKAEKRTIVEKVSATGKIQPEMEIKLAPDVSGEITELFIKEGDSVTKGQLLLRIRPDNYVSAVDRAQAGVNSQRANLSQTKSRLTQAKAQYERSKIEYDRNKDLFDKKIISQQEFLTAKTNFEVAESELSAAEQAVEASRYTVESTSASLDEARKNLQLTEVYAPLSGIVSKLSVEKGERVVGTIQMAGTEMLRIANLHDMEVSVDVNENDIVRVSMGDTAIIEVDAYTGESFRGLVTSISNSAKDALGTSDAVTEFEVKIRLLSSSYTHLISESRKFPFRPGMTAAVEIVTERKENVLSVPLSAVTTRDFSKNNKAIGAGGEEENTSSSSTTKEDIREVIFLYVDGKSVMTEVKTGISDFDYIEILKGLDEGKEIITGPYKEVSKDLKDGSKVGKIEKNKRKFGPPN